MGKKKVIMKRVVVLMFSTLSIVFVGGGIYNVYADGSRPLPLVEDIINSAQDALIPPGEIRKAPKRKEHSVPETPEKPLEQPDLLTEDDSAPPPQKDEKDEKSEESQRESVQEKIQPGPVSPAPKAVQSEPVISPVPVPDPKPTPEKESETKSQLKAKSASQPKAKSAGSVNSGADAKEEKGEKMAKTGFSPLPLVQMIGGLLGLGGTALYGMRRKSDG